MKSISLMGGITVVTIGGFGLLPSLTIFVGAVIIASIISILFCNRMDKEFLMVEKILYAMMANACLSAVVSIALPNAFSIELDGVVLLCTLSGAFVGTLAGGILASAFEHKETKHR